MQQVKKHANYPAIVRNAMNLNGFHSVAVQILLFSKL